MDDPANKSGTANLSPIERKHLELMQQQLRLSTKSAPVVMVSALLQEAVNLNQQLVQHSAELMEALKNERERKSPNADGGKVPGTARPASG
jgi:hypothetical protein